MILGSGYASSLHPSVRKKTKMESISSDTHLFPLISLISCDNRLWSPTLLRFIAFSDIVLSKIVVGYFHNFIDQFTHANCAPAISLLYLYNNASECIPTFEHAVNYTIPDGYGICDDDERTRKKYRRIIFEMPS